MLDLPSSITLDGSGAALVGAGPPRPEIGINGDFYIDVEAELLFGPKTTGLWPKGGRLINEQLSAMARVLHELHRRAAEASTHDA
jgi:hypothetical protein